MSISKRSLRSSALVALVAGLSTPVLAAAPDNDSYASAKVVSFPKSKEMGSTRTATNDGITPGTSVIAGSATAADVWYKVTIPTAGAIAVTTCGDTTVYDTALQVFNVNEDGTLGTRVGEDDDNCNNRGATATLRIRKSKVVFSAVAGKTYAVRVFGRTGMVGDFELHVMTNPSNNLMPPDQIQTDGPDMVIGNINDVMRWGAGTLTGLGAGPFAGVPATGLSVGTESWGVGTVPVDWFDYNTTINVTPVGGGAAQAVQKRSNQHPVIAQQAYRLKDGKFEQIGHSWLKNGFTSTNSASFQAEMAFPSDQNRTRQSPPQGGDQLGINASDLYGGSLNGSRTYLAPRFDPNPLTGVYTHPFTPLVPAEPPSSDALSRRLIVPTADLAGAANPGARYFVDGVYVTRDDAQWGHGLNNYSSREWNGSSSSPALSSGTARRMTALQWWPEIDPTVSLVNVDFHEQSVTVPDYRTNPATQVGKDLTGRFQVASKVTANGDGTYSYEYAVLNMNSHRAMSSIMFRLPANAGITDTGFRGGFYHSYDRVDNTPWVNSQAGGMLKWDVNMTYPTTMVVPNVGTVTVDPNALRYGALHNYRFKSTVAPIMGSAKMKLWRAPADATGYQGDVLVISGIHVPKTCITDIAGPGQTTTPDGELTADDIIVFVNAFFANDLVTADVAGAGQVATPDLQLTADDIIVFINGFFAGCV